jgi:hypothetical protein
MKLDVNGEAANDQGMISDYTDLSSRDVGPYLALNDFPPSVNNLAFSIDKSAKPSTPAFKTIIRDMSSAAVNAAIPVGSEAFPKVIPSQIPPKATTWAEIAYESTEGADEIKPIYKTAIEINQELLPILNEQFANKVKLRKDVSGVMEYVFARLVSTNDIAPIQKYLEGRGYKTYSSDKDQIVMMKIGRTLTLTFSISDKTRGSLFVSH